MDLSHSWLSGSGEALSEVKKDPYRKEIDLMDCFCVVEPETRKGDSVFYL